MDIVFRPHAVERMLQRKIRPADVELVIHESDGKIRQSRDKWIYYKRLKGRQDNLVAVVTVKKQELCEVVTVLVNFEVKNES